MDQIGNYNSGSKCHFTTVFENMIKHIKSQSYVSRSLMANIGKTLATRYDRGQQISPKKNYS